MNTRKRDTHDEQQNKIAKTTHQSEQTISKKIDEMNVELKHCHSITKQLKVEMEKVGRFITDKSGAILEITEEMRIASVNLQDVQSDLKGIKTDMEKVSHSLFDKEGAILNITDETRMVVKHSVVTKLDNMQDRVESMASDIKSFISEEIDRKFESYKTNSINNQNCANSNSDEMEFSDNENSSNILNEGQYQKPVEGKYRFFCVHVSKFSL